MNSTVALWKIVVWAVQREKERGRDQIPRVGKRKEGKEKRKGLWNGNTEKREG